MTASWKRLLLAGGLTVPAVAALAERAPVQVLDLEPEATLFFLGFPMIYGLLSIPAVDRGLARLWPGFPAALDPVFERVEKTPFSPFEKGRCFVGRGQAMSLLVGAALDDGPGLRWGQIYGPSGMGKTRLGLEWLKALRGRGWDAGLLRGELSAAELRRAIFRRRPTAILIDDADADPALWEKLDALAQLPWRRPARVLFTSTATLNPPSDLPPESLERLKAARDAGPGGSMLVAKLTRHDVALWRATGDLRPAARGGRGERPAAPPEADALATASTGRPFFVRLLADVGAVSHPWRAVAALADARVAAAAKALGRRGPELLALAALAGPFPLAEAAAVLELKKPPRAGRLARALPELATAPPGVLPALRPGLLAVEVALRVLASLDPWARERLGEKAFELNPAAAAARFAVIDAERGEALDMFRRDAEAAMAAEQALQEAAEPALQETAAAETGTG